MALDEYRSQDLVDNGNRLAEAGRHTDAIKLFKRARQLGARGLGVNIGNSYAALGDNASAREEFLTEWSRSGDLDAGFNYAEALRDTDRDGARRVLRELIDRGYAKAVVNESDELREDGRDADANKLLATALHDPEVGDFAAGILGSSLYRDGRLDEAEQLLRRASDIDPAARSDLGHVLRALGRPDEAFAIWTQGADRDETESILPLANALASLQKPEEAKRLYRRGYELGDAHAATNLAIQLWDEGEQDHALKWIARAVAMGDETAARWKSSLDRQSQ